MNRKPKTPLDRAVLEATTLVLSAVAFADMETDRGLDLMAKNIYDIIQGAIETHTKDLTQRIKDLEAVNSLVAGKEAK